MKTSEGVIGNQVVMGMKHQPLMQGIRDEIEQMPGVILGGELFAEMNEVNGARIEKNGNLPGLLPCGKRGIGVGETDDFENIHHVFPQKKAPQPP